MLKRNKLQKLKHGFTLAELLIVVAIIGILGALSFVAVSRYQRNLKCRELDSTAKEIYMTAQNDLTYEKFLGNIRYASDYRKSSAEGTSVNTDPQDQLLTDYIPNGSSGKIQVNAAIHTGGNEFAENSILNVILPAGSIDDTVRKSGNYVVIYTVPEKPAGAGSDESSSGDNSEYRILDVFYSAETSTSFGKSTKYDFAGLSDLSKLTSSAVRNKSDNTARKHFPESSDPGMIGWYGSEDNTVSYKKLNQIEDFEVVNGNMLYAHFFYQPKTTKERITAVVEGVTSKKKVIVSPIETTPKDMGSKQEYILPLDNITNMIFPTASGSDDQRFVSNLKDIKDEDKLIPGEDIVVKVRVFSLSGQTSIDGTSDLYFESDSDGIVTNSLFDHVELTNEDDVKNNGAEPVYTAYISNARHLENLESSISGIQRGKAENGDTSASKINITQAIQTEDIDWKNGFISNISSLYNDYTNSKKSSLSIIYNSGAESVSGKENSYIPVNVEQALTYSGIKDASDAYSIENVEISQDSTDGIFGVVHDALTVDSINFKNITIKPEKNEGKDSGIIAGAVEKMEADSAAYKNASLAVKNCFVINPVIAIEKNDSTSNNGKNVGGVAGHASGSVTIQNTGVLAEDKYHYYADYDNKVDAIRTHGDNAKAGGLIGYIQSQGDVTIDNSFASVSVKSDYVKLQTDDNIEAAGGLIGGINLKYENKETADHITITNSYAGGLVNEDHQYDKQYPNVESSYAGGLIGYVYKGKQKCVLNIDHSYTTASVINQSTIKTDDDTAIGGLIGHLETNAFKYGKYTFDHVYSAGSVMDVSSAEKHDIISGSLIGRLVDNYMPADSQAYGSLEEANDINGISSMPVVGNAKDNAVFKTKIVSNSSLTDESGAAVIPHGYNNVPDSQFQISNYPFADWTSLNLSRTEGEKHHYGDWPVKTETPSGFKVNNGNKLSVDISFEKAPEGRFFLKIVGETSQHVRYMEIKRQGKEFLWRSFNGSDLINNAINNPNWWLGYNSSPRIAYAADSENKNFRVYLDDPTQQYGNFTCVVNGCGPQRQDAGDSYIMPGENIRIYASSDGKSWSSKYARTNSIFGDDSVYDKNCSETHIAKVYSARHLLNLSTIVSGYKEKKLDNIQVPQITTAVQQADILWDGDPDPSMNLQCPSYLTEIKELNAEINKLNKPNEVEVYVYSHDYQKLGSADAFAGINPEDGFAEYDGNYKTIKNLVVSDFYHGSTSGGLFNSFGTSHTTDVKIHDLKLEGITAPVTNSTGSLIGNVNMDHNLTIDNVTLTDFIAGANNDVGGLIGTIAKAGTVTISNVSLKDNNGISLSAANAGGLIGSVNDASELNINDAVLDGKKFTITGSTLNGGGVIGIADLSNNSKINIQNIHLNSDDADITGNYTSGGIAGKLQAGSVIVNNVSTTGRNFIVNAASQNAGGLAGIVSGTALFDRTYSTAIVHGGYSAGGLIGELQSSGNTVIKNSFSGGHTVDKTGRYSKTDFNITGSSWGSAGGLIGQSTGSAEIRNTYSTASVQGKENARAGGLVGKADNQVSVFNSYAVGLVDSVNNHAHPLIGEGSLKSYEKNYYLAKINPGKTDPYGTGVSYTDSPIVSSNTIAENAHKYDSSLPEIYSYKTIHELNPDSDLNEQYGDWPDPRAEVVITKSFQVNGDKADAVTYDSVKDNGRFVFVNRDTDRLYYADLSDFEADGDSYTYAMQLPEGSYKLEEIGSEVDKYYLQETYATVNDVTNAASADTFDVRKGQTAAVSVTNTYSPKADIYFMYKNPADQGSPVVIAKNESVPEGGKIIPPANPKVAVYKGYIFTGNWYPADKDGNQIGDKALDPEKDVVPFGEADAAGEYNLYYVAEYRKLPVITLDYVAVANEGTASMEKYVLKSDAYYQIALNDAFDAEIVLKDQMKSDDYTAASVYEEIASADGKTTEIKVDSADASISSDGKSVKFNVQSVSENKHYEIRVNSNKFASYKVVYKFEHSMGSDIDHLEYSENDTAVISRDEDTFKGVEGLYTTISARSLIDTPDGFKDPEWSNVVIKGDNTSEVVVLFRRKVSKVEYNLNGGMSAGGDSYIDSAYFEAGENVVLPDHPTKAGYTFKGWIESIGGSTETSVENSFAMPGEDVKISAVWEPENPVAYKVEFWVEDVKDQVNAADADKKFVYNNYTVCKAEPDHVITLDELKNQFGNPSKVTDVRISKAGNDNDMLVFNSERTGKTLKNEDGSDTEVKQDGSTVVKVYYDRKAVTFTFNYSDPADNASYGIPQYYYGSTFVTHAYNLPYDTTAITSRTNGITADFTEVTTKDFQGNTYRAQQGVDEWHDKNTSSAWFGHTEVVPLVGYDLNGNAHEAVYGLDDWHNQGTENAWFGHGNYEITYTSQYDPDTYYGWYVVWRPWKLWVKASENTTGAVYAHAKENRHGYYDVDEKTIISRSPSSQWVKEGNVWNLYDWSSDTVVFSDASENDSWHLVNDNYVFGHEESLSFSDADPSVDDYQADGTAYAGRFGHISNDLLVSKHQVKFTGLYQATFENYGFHWDDQYDWYDSLTGNYYYNGRQRYRATGSHITFLDGFSQKNDQIFYAYGNPSGNSHIVHYVEDLNGNWVKKNDTLTDNGFNFTFTNKYQGFTVSAYNVTNFDLDKDVITNDERGRVYAANPDETVGAENRLNVFHARNKWHIAYGNTLNERYAKDGGEWKSVSTDAENDVRYEQKILSSDVLPGSEYVNSHKSLFIPDQDHSLTDDIDHDYIFEGWYTSAAFREEDRISEDNPAFLNSMPNSNFQVFAHWTAPEVKVHIYNTDSPKAEADEIQWKQAADPISVSKKSKVSSDSALYQALSSVSSVDDRFEISGWYYGTQNGPDYNRAFNDEDLITSETWLYPKYAQTSGMKEIRIMLEAPLQEDGKTRYFQIDHEKSKPGVIVAKVDQNHKPVLSETKDYYVMTGEFNSRITVSAPVLNGYAPTSTDKSVILDNAANDVVFYYQAVNTWGYTVNCVLQQNDGSEYVLQSVHNSTYYAQVIEAAPAFDGFRLADPNDNIKVINEEGADDTYVFRYVVDTDHQYEITGVKEEDHPFEMLKQDLGQVESDGQAHGVTTSDVLPENVKATATYYDSDGNVLASAPSEVGNYTAIVSVDAGDLNIWRSTDKIHLQILPWEYTIRHYLEGTTIEIKPEDTTCSADHNTLTIHSSIPGFEPVEKEIHASDLSHAYMLYYKPDLTYGETPSHYADTNTKDQKLTVTKTDDVLSASMMADGQEHGLTITGLADTVSVHSSFVTSDNQILDTVKEAGSYTAVIAVSAGDQVLWSKTIPVTIEPREYTVKFDKNKADAEGTMADQKIGEGKETALSENAFTCGNDEFWQWNTKADGSGQIYQNSEKVTDLAEAGKEITLYAIWKSDKKIFGTEIIPSDNLDGSYWPLDAENGTKPSALKGIFHWTDGAYYLVKGNLNNMNLRDLVEKGPAENQYWWGGVVELSGKVSAYENISDGTKLTKSVSTGDICIYNRKYYVALDNIGINTYGNPAQNTWQWYEVPDASAAAKKSVVFDLNEDD